MGALFIDSCFGVIMKSVLISTNKGDWGRRNYIINTSDEDLLVFGASRAVHHYDTKILSDSLCLSCYNCGEDGMGILVHLPRLRRIIQRYHPKVVIYEVAPKYDFLNWDNISCLKLLRPYSDDSLVAEVIRDIDKNELLKLYSNLYKYNSSFLEILSQRFSRVPAVAKDFTYSPITSVMNYEPGPAGQFEGNGVDSIKYKYLGELADLCHSYGVKLYFTASPWYKMEDSAAFVPIYQLCERKGITFLNHNFDTAFNYRKEYFHDAAHLNKFGAETFSKVIAHEIKQQYNVSSR